MENISEEQVTNWGGVGGLSLIESGPPPIEDYIPWLDGDNIVPGGDYSDPEFIEPEYRIISLALERIRLENEEAG